MNQHSLAQQSVPLVELDLLRTFVAIIDTGSFAAAAEQVFRTPSAVSMQIKKLEETIGRPVLVRDSRSVSLTRDGETLLEHGRRMLALNREVMAKFVVPDLAGVVRLGAPDDVSERFLPEMLRMFADSHPGITIDVIVENTNHLIERVRRGDVDIAMVTCGIYTKGQDVEILLEEPLVWACARGGVAAERDPIPVSVWEEGCTWRTAGLEGLEKSGRQYRIAFHSAYMSGQKAAILADLAIAPLPRSALSGDIVEADASFDLPKLPCYGLGMMVSDKGGTAVRAAADHLRACFARRRDGATQRRAA